jgi:acetyl esterase/lipase
MTRHLLKLYVLLALCLTPLAILHAQAGAAIPPPIFLYPNAIPGALGDTEADKPRMYAFLPKTRSTSAAVLVIPGGGYEHVAIGHEGFQIATWLNAQGMPAFVLDYRVKPYRYPV